MWRYAGSLDVRCVRTCVCNPAALKAAEELHARSKGYSTSVQRTQPRPGWAPDPLMVGIRSPDGLVVGLAQATLELWVRFPNERNQGKQGATLCWTVENCQPSNPTNFGLVFRSPRTLRVFGDLMSNISATRGRPDMRFCVCGSPSEDLSHIASLTIGCSR